MFFIHFTIITNRIAYHQQTIKNYGINIHDHYLIHQESFAIQIPLYFVTNNLVFNETESKVLSHEGQRQQEGGTRSQNMGRKLINVAVIKSEVLMYFIYKKIFLKIYADHTKLHNCASVIFGIFVNSLNAYDKTKQYTYFVCLLQMLNFVLGIWL